jgi:hypothetical protein
MSRRRLCSQIRRLEGAWVSLSGWAAEGKGGGEGEGHGNAGAAFLYRRAEVHDVPVGWHHAAGEDLGRNVPAPRRATPGRWTWVGGTARPCRTTCVKPGRGEG